MASDVIQVLGTLGEIMSFMAPNLGGEVPSETSDEYSVWRTAIQLKQEEAARRGFWRRLLTKDTSLTLEVGDESVLLPIRFQRANSLYIFALDDIDLADPDRTPDGQSVFAVQDNEPTVVSGETTIANPNYGRWSLNFQTAIETVPDEVVLWYFANPPKPVDSTDKVLLPGDMIAYGAMSEIFRTTNLEGSQDDARIEFENRLSTYLGMESIPSRNEILQFTTNPRAVDRTTAARNQYLLRPDRVSRSY
jgi:hypothetical protein